MPATPPTSEPAILVIGANWEWDRTSVKYPPSEGWTLTYELKGTSEVAAITAATSSAGDYYEVRENKAASQGFQSGTYSLIGRVDSGANGHQIYYDTVWLLPDLTDASVVDGLTLDEMEAAQLTKAIQAIQSDPFRVTEVGDRRFESERLPEYRQERGIIWARIQATRRQGHERRKVVFGAVS